MLIIKKDILILAKGSTQGLEHTMTTEKKLFSLFSCDKKEVLLKLALQWSK